MTITYTGNLKLAQPTTGTEAGTWGDVVNQQITALLDQSVAGTASLTSMTNADYTLTSGNGSAPNEARYMALSVPATLTLTAARNIIVPTSSKAYIIRNLTTGGFAVTLKTSAGTGISVPNGKTMILYCDGTNVIDGTDYFTSITVGALTATGNVTAAKFIPTGGTATGNGMYLPATNAIAWSNNGAETMRLDASGNLGIGTSSPGAKLHVAAGNVRVNDGYQFEFGGGTNSISGSNASNYLLFYTNNIERMRLDASGNLGIGASSPRGLLDLNTSRNVKVYFGTSGTIGETATSAGDYVANNLYVSAEVAGNMTYTKIAGDDGNAIIQDYTRGITFYTGVTGAVTTTGTLNSFERMRLDGSGNLGLGVTPSAWNSGFKAIQSSAGAVVSQGTTNFRFWQNSYIDSGATIRYINTATAAGYELAAGVHSWYNAPSGTAGNAITFTQAMTLTAAGDLALGGTTASTNLSGSATVFQVTDPNLATVALDRTGAKKFSISSINVSALIFYDETDSVERARIDSSGNLGVGTTSPYKTITVGVSDATAWITAGGSDVNLTLSSVGTAGSLVFRTGGTNSNPSTTTERARIDASGNLLVGVTSKMAGGISGLDINNASGTPGITFGDSGAQKAFQFLNAGISRYQGETATGYTIAFVSGGSNGVTLANGGTSWGALSDERKKNIIEPIVDASNKVATLRAVIGKYKTDDDGTRRSFLIAQDVQAVLPEAVVEDNNGDLILQYTDTIPLLVAAIKEQQALITSLTARIAALEAK